MSHYNFQQWRSRRRSLLSSIVCLFLVAFSFLCNDGCSAWVITIPSSPSPSRSSFQHRKISRCRTNPLSLSSASEGSGDSSSSSSSSKLKSKLNTRIRIRQCEFNELGAVANIIMDSFYVKKTPWHRLYQLAEFNRLQQNFPYADTTDVHQMLVAVATVSDDDDRTVEENSSNNSNNNNNNNNRNGEIVVGFVDIDTRPCKTKIILPRPYLSDLAVHPDYRRKGIARQLVNECEAFIIQQQQQKQQQQSELWIRVEATNEAAVAMYQSLNYDTTGSEENKDTKGKVTTILTLHKTFAEQQQQQQRQENLAMGDGSTTMSSVKPSDTNTITSADMIVDSSGSSEDFVI